jgi:UDP-2,4-diacetamido-2,4,6-trideoxy-beta-L-altropyranose hydrolase
VRDLPGSIHGRIPKTYTTHLLPYKEQKDEIPWLRVSLHQEIHESLELMLVLRPDWIVMDHYGLDEHWQSHMRPFVQKICVIDDLANRNHDCDLLIDQGAGTPELQARYDSCVPSSCVRALGPSYSLLSPHFLKYEPRVRTKIERVHIFLGGADDTNDTEPIADLCAKMFPHIDLILGGSNRDAERLCHKYHRQPFHVWHDVSSEKMAELLSHADLCIGSTGCSSFERCYLGIPAVAITIADNQKFIAQFLQKVGCVIYIGDHQESYTDRLRIILSKLTSEKLQKLSKAALQVVPKGLDSRLSALFTL